MFQAGAFAAVRASGLYILAVLLILGPGLYMGAYDKTMVQDLGAEVTGDLGAWFNEFLHFTSFMWTAAGFALLLRSIISSPMALLIIVVVIMILVIVWENWIT